MEDDKFEIGKLEPKDDESINTLEAEITEVVEPRQVIGYLREMSIINDEDKDSIYKIPRRKERVEELIGIIRNRGPRAFDGFVSALSKGRYESLASKLKQMARGNGGAKPKQMTAKGNTRSQEFKSTQVKRAVTQSYETPVRKTSARTSPGSERNRPVSAKKIAVVKPNQGNLPRDRGRPTSAGGRGKQLQTAPEEDQTDPKVIVPNIQANEPPQVVPARPETPRSVTPPAVREEYVAIQQSLNSTHFKVKDHAEIMLPMLDLLSSDDEENNKDALKKELAEHVKRVEEEKKAVEKSANQNDEKFNRDMMLMVHRMNEMLSFMMGVLQKLVVSLKDKGSDYQSKITTMTSEIDRLHKELEAKNEELIEAKRDFQADTHMLKVDLKKAVKALEKATASFNPLFLEQNQKDSKNESEGDAGYFPCYSSEPVYLQPKNDTEPETDTEPESNRTTPLRGQKNIKQKEKKKHLQHDRS